MGVVTGRVHRGEVWLVCLDPTRGAEIKKTRPCLVVSPPEIHNPLRTALVVPLTSKGFAAPFRVPVLFAGREGLALLDQLRAVDKARLIKPLGCVNAEVLREVLTVLQEVFSV